MMPGISRGRRWTYGLLTAGALGLVIFGQPADESGAAAITPVADPGSARNGAAPDASRTDRARTGHHSRGTLSVDAAAFLTRLAHRSSDDKAAADLFASHSWYVPPPPPPPAPVAPPAPPPAPTAPPLPFAFLGSFAADGDATTYFLSRGDRIYDVKVGDSIDAEYSIDAIEGTNLICNYKPLKTRQILPTGASP